MGADLFGEAVTDIQERAQGFEEAIRKILILIKSITIFDFLNVKHHPNNSQGFHFQQRGADGF